VYIGGGTTSDDTSKIASVATDSVLQFIKEKLVAPTIAMPLKLTIVLFLAELCADSNMLWVIGAKAGFTKVLLNELQFLGAVTGKAYLSPQIR
jgi:hypothetical protein